MRSLIAAAEIALMDRLIKGGPLLPRSRTLETLMCATGLSSLAALGFGLYGFYLWLSQNYPPEVTAFAMAGAFLGVSLLSSLLALAYRMIRQSKISQAKDDIRSMIGEWMDKAEEEFGEPIRENPKSSAALASMAGFMVGERLR